MSNKLEKPLSHADLQKLRLAGVITSEEIAIIVGDLILAENVVSKDRRILETNNILLESTRRVLKG